MTRNVIQYLEQSAERCPDKTAFADLERSYTYRELLDTRRWTPENQITPLKMGLRAEQRILT